MTKYRIFLLSMTTISWVFLSELSMAVDNDKLVLEDQKTTVVPDYYDTEHVRKLMELKQLKAKNYIKSVKANPQPAKQKTSKATKADDNNPPKRDELEKPLDLSVPYNAPENKNMLLQQRSAAQSRKTNIFAPETGKKPSPIEVDGDFLMTPYPEEEKLKSVDGAGIVIKINR